MVSDVIEQNADIKKLLDKGYAVSLDSNHLVVRDIPYIDDKGTLQIGAIVSVIDFVSQNKAKMKDHQIYFCGSHPHELNGNPIRNLGGGASKVHLISEDLLVQRSFSNKPPSGKFLDWFEKIESYVTIISGPAINKFDANPLTFRFVEEDYQSVFKFRDTLSSRSEIGELSAKLENDKIAIIGLGGTGAYLLDFLAKTPVREIRAFDGDWYHVHNAFRSPGEFKEIELGKKKAEVYKNRYESFRTDINFIPAYVTSDSVEELNGISFAFIAIDDGESRKEIFNLLVRLKIPFIDVGMGLDKDTGLISGTLRTTYYSEENARDLIDKNLAPFSNIPDDVYKSNIQISELNALNACFAVIRYKQLRGFYCDDNPYLHSLYNIDGTNLVSENGDN